MPTLASTFGVHHAAAGHLEPAPCSCQTRQPLPLQNTHSMSTSAEAGERKIRRAETDASLRSKKRSTKWCQHRLQVREAHALVHHQASTWWNIGVCRHVGIRSGRRGPAMIIPDGGLSRSIARTCTGEVWLREQPAVREIERVRASPGPGDSPDVQRLELCQCPRLRGRPRH